MQASACVHEHQSRAKEGTCLRSGKIYCKQTIVTASQARKDETKRQAELAKHDSSQLDLSKEQRNVGVSPRMSLYMCGDFWDNRQIISK